MATTGTDRAFLRRSFVLSLILGALAFIPRAPLGAPVLEAQGRPDRAGLEAQHRRLLPLFELAGVVFTDADETSGRLVVGVLERDVEGLVRGRLRALGVASQSVDVVETDAIFALASLRDPSLHIQGGLQINFSQYVCSIGFIAFRNGEEGFVTASHCSDRQGAVDGTTYYQPSSQVSNSFIGTEIADPPYVRNSSGCPKGKKCRLSDANFSRRGGGSFTLGAIARTTGLGSLVIDVAQPTFTITGERDAIEVIKGDSVDKVGRTTGWTQGKVSNTCVNTGVSGTSIVLLCQTFVASINGGVIVAGGDSGSPAFISSGSEATLVGGLWGGSQDGKMFVYSPIDNIRTELDMNLATH